MGGPEINLLANGRDSDSENNLFKTAERKKYIKIQKDMFLFLFTSKFGMERRCTFPGPNF